MDAVHCNKRVILQVIYATGRIVGSVRLEEGISSAGAHGDATALQTQNFNPNRFLLKAFVRILNASPYKELSLTDANRVSLLLLTHSSKSSFISTRVISEHYSCICIWV